MPNISSIYRPRNPWNSAYYRCVEDHFERFEQGYEERFERQYGFFRAYVKKVIYRYRKPVWKDIVQQSGINGLRGSYKRGCSTPYRP